MALPPHLIWKLIDGMPEGPAKERHKRLYRLQAQVIVAVMGALLLFLLVSGAWHVAGLVAGLFG